MELSGNANARISRLRREKVCQDLNKALIPLAKDDENFDNAPPALFGTEFAKKAKDHVDQVKALGSSTKDRRASVFSRRPPPPPPPQQGGLQLQDQRRERWRQLQLVLPPPQRWRPKQLEPQLSERRRPVPAKETTGLPAETGPRNKDLVKSVSMNVSTSTLSHIAGLGVVPIMPPDILAGRLAHHIQNWVRITRDRWVLDTVQGYCIEFLTIPYQTKRPHLPRYNATQNQLNNRRSRRTSAERGCGRGGGASRGILLNPVLSPQKGWRTEAINKPRGLKLLHTTSALQDGRDPYLEGTHETWRLVDLKDAYFTIQYPCTAARGST